MIIKSAILAAGIALAFNVSAAGGQSYVAGVVPPTDRAETLRLQAHAFIAAPGQWRRATPLLERSATLSAPGDARAVESLRLAGHLRANAGEFDAARRNFESAAQRALAMGHLVDAANAYLDAAFAAGQRGDAEGVDMLTERATLLSASPLLSEAQSLSIRRRITG